MAFGNVVYGIWGVGFFIAYINNDCVDLDLFYGKVIFGTSGFLMERVLKVHFSVAIVLALKFNLYEILDVKVIC